MYISIYCIRGVSLSHGDGNERRALKLPLLEALRGTIGFGDLDTLVTDILMTSFGDANLDGAFDSSDLVAIFPAGEYNDMIENNSRWRTGDWNCDREFDTSDLVLAFQAGRFELPSPSGPIV